MERLPTFAANIQRPVLEAIHRMDFDTETQYEREQRAQAVADEIVALACPLCGHITPDHSWTLDEAGLMPCLAGRDHYGRKITSSCTCPGFPYTGDLSFTAIDAEVRALVDEALGLTPPTE